MRTLFNKVHRWPTFEGQKKRECSYHQHHSESEREDGYINLKGERRERVLHLEHKDNAVWVLHIITHQEKLIALVYKTGQHYGRQVWVRWRRGVLLQKVQSWWQQKLPVYWRNTRCKSKTRHLMKIARLCNNDMNNNLELTFLLPPASCKSLPLFALTKKTTHIPL